MFSRSVFGDGLFVGLYDEVKAAPEALVRQLWEFIGLSPVDLPEDVYRKVVFEGPRASMPGDLRSQLVARYAPEVEFVAEYLGMPELVSRWSR